jgi:hypothetical protein
MSARSTRGIGDREGKPPLTGTCHNRERFSGFDLRERNSTCAPSGVQPVTRVPVGSHVSLLGNPEIGFRCEHDTISLNIRAAEEWVRDLSGGLSDQA